MENFAERINIIKESINILEETISQRGKIIYED